MRLKYFLRNINLLNILLIATVIFFSNYSFFLMFITKVKYSLPSVTKTFYADKASSDETPRTSSSDYLIISEENLFHPERKIPPEKKEEAAPLPKPDFILYGTVITPDTSLAYMEDLKTPRNTAGRGKRQTPLKKGDMMSGFILKEVQSDKIVMVRGEEKMVVRVYNPSRSKTKDLSTPGQAQLAPLPEKPESPSRKEPLTKTRAPMTRTDEKIRGFFQRQ
jgi:hypothetical protein